MSLRPPSVGRFYRGGWRCGNDATVCGITDLPCRQVFWLFWNRVNMAVGDLIEVHDLPLLSFENVQPE